MITFTVHSGLTLIALAFCYCFAITNRSPSYMYVQHLMSISTVCSAIAHLSFSVFSPFIWECFRNRTCNPLGRKQPYINPASYTNFQEKEIIEILVKRFSSVRIIYSKTLFQNLKMLVQRLYKCFLYFTLKKI